MLGCRRGLEVTACAQGVQAYENVTVDAARCGFGRFWVNGACSDCSACAAGSYRVAPCGPVWDTGCQACSTCAATQYLYRACGETADTVCYSLQVRDLTVRVAWVSQYDGWVLANYTSLFVDSLGTISGGTASLVDELVQFVPVDGVSLVRDAP